jgi:hypothetical protein
MTVSAMAMAIVTEAGRATRRRLALVVARHHGRPGSPPGIDPDRFALACLSDSYEVLADLVGVTSGIAGDASDLEDLLWPGAVRLPAVSCQELVALAGTEFDELVLVPADVPDLPGLVVAKVFKALQRAEVCVAPERGGAGCAAIGISTPWPAWLSGDLDLDTNPVERLQALAPSRTRVAVAPSWHRMRTPDAIQRLDPGLEGWELTRSLLSGAPVSGEV